MVGGQSASATITINVLAPIDTWRQQNFGSTSNTGLFADTADKDNDGISNLIEYATASNPNASNPFSAAATKNGSTIDFIYTKNKSATDVTFTVEWTDDFTTWSTAGVTQPYPRLRQRHHPANQSHHARWSEWKTFCASEGNPTLRPVCCGASSRSIVRE